MRLYSWDLSPYSARIRMQIYAKRLTEITIEKPPNYGTSKFEEDNPIGRLPLLEIDGETIAESNVIAEYLEEIYPEPLLLGKTPRENAEIRTLTRVGEIYLINNTFMLAIQTRVFGAEVPVTTGNEKIVAQLSDELTGSVKILDRMIGRDGFACLGRLTLADCALVSALFLLDNVLPGSGLVNPVEENANVVAYWAAIRKEDSAARVLAELERGLEERRHLIRSRAAEEVWAATYTGNTNGDPKHPSIRQSDAEHDRPPRELMAPPPR